MKHWLVEHGDIREFLTVMGVGLSAYLAVILTVIQIWFA